MACCIGLLASASLSGCASLPSALPKAASFAIAPDAETTLGKLAARARAGHPSQLSGFRLLPEAAFALDARISLIRSAETSVDIQYYLLERDDVGLMLLRELRDAANRGVRVRLLVDDFYLAGKDDLFVSFAAFRNTEVRVFNPLPSRNPSPGLRILLSLHELGRINHRMHNKLLVVDNSFAISGGRNIANEYFMRSATANFIDMDVLSSGPVVNRLSQTFDLYWNSAQVRTIEELVPSPTPAATRGAEFDTEAASASADAPLRPADVLGASPVGEQIVRSDISLYWAEADVHADSPEKVGRSPQLAYAGSVREAAVLLLRSARSQVDIASPYFIPGQNGIDLVRKQVAAGIKVTIVTNSLGSTDEPLAYAGYERYRREILRAGGQIYEIAPYRTAKSGRFGSFGASISRLHAKWAMIDERRMFVGSMNLDPRSAATNTELGLSIDAPEMVKGYASLFASNRNALGYQVRLLDDGDRIEWVELRDDGTAETIFVDVPGSHLWQRVKSWFLLPIIGEDLL